VGAQVLQHPAVDHVRPGPPAVLVQLGGRARRVLEQDLLALRGVGAGAGPHLHLEPLFAVLVVELAEGRYLAVEVLARGVDGEEDDLAGGPLRRGGSLPPRPGAGGEPQQPAPRPRQGAPRHTGAPPVPLVPHGPLLRSEPTPSAAAAPPAGAAPS